MTEFISRKYGKEGYEIIIKTDSHEHYRTTEDFARRLIDHSKPATNADRIRAMSDEKLAKFLNWCEAMGYEDSSIAIDSSGLCMNMLEWLQQPAPEEDKHETD